MSRSSVFVDELSEKLKPLNDLVEELEGIGLESLDIKLPSIASVGDQSSGTFSFHPLPLLFVPY